MNNVKFFIRIAVLFVWIPSIASWSMESENKKPIFTKMKLPDANLQKKDFDIQYGTYSLIFHGDALKNHGKSYANALKEGFLIVKYQIDQLRIAANKGESNNVSGLLKSLLNEAQDMSNLKNLVFNEAEQGGQHLFMREFLEKHPEMLNLGLFQRTYPDMDLNRAEQQLLISMDAIKNGYIETIKFLHKQSKFLLPNVENGLEDVILRNHCEVLAFFLNNYSVDPYFIAAALDNAAKTADKDMNFSNVIRTLIKHKIQPIQLLRGIKNEKIFLCVVTEIKENFKNDQWYDVFSCAAHRNMTEPLNYILENFGKHFVKNRLGEVLAGLANIGDLKVLQKVIQEHQDDLDSVNWFFVFSRAIGSKNLEMVQFIEDGFGSKISLFQLRNIIKQLKKVKFDEAIENYIGKLIIIKEENDKNSKKYDNLEEEIEALNEALSNKNKKDVKNILESSPDYEKLICQFYKVDKIMDAIFIAAIKKHSQIFRFVFDNCLGMGIDQKLFKEIHDVAEENGIMETSITGEIRFIE